MGKYYVKKAIEYGCVVYQVINSETGTVCYYDGDEMIADKFCKRQNEFCKTKN